MRANVRYGFGLVFFAVQFSALQLRSD